MRSSDSAAMGQDQSGLIFLWLKMQQQRFFRISNIRLELYGIFNMTLKDADPESFRDYDFLCF